MFTQKINFYLSFQVIIIACLELNNPNIFINPYSFRNPLIFHHTVFIIILILLTYHKKCI